MKKMVILGTILLTSLTSFAMDRKGLEKCVAKEIQDVAKNPGLYRYASEKAADEKEPWTDHFNVMNVLWHMENAVYDKDQKTVQKIRNLVLSASSCGDLIDSKEKEYFDREYSYYLKGIQDDLAMNKEMAAKVLNLGLIAETLKPTHFHLNNLLGNLGAEIDFFTGTDPLLRPEKVRRVQLHQDVKSIKGLTADAAEEVFRKRYNETESDLRKSYAEAVEKVDSVIFGTSQSQAAGKVISKGTK